jgi:hypothetical protein
MNVEKADKKIEVQVITPSGNYPNSGFTEHNVNQKVRIVLQAAARELELQNTDSWKAKVNDQVINPELSFAENNLHGRVKIFWAPEERGGGLHPAASEEFFKTEVSSIVQNREFLDALHAWPLRWVYPELRIGVLHLRSGNLRVFQFLFRDWDEHPPGFDLLSAEHGNPLGGAEWPTNAPGQSHWHHGNWESANRILVPRSAFLCMRGIREYHEHRQHVTDRWENYRGKAEYTMAGILTRSIDAFQQANV